MVYYLTDDFNASDRCLFCYQESNEDRGVALTPTLMLGLTSKQKARDSKQKGSWLLVLGYFQSPIPNFSALGACHQTTKNAPKIVPVHNPAVLPCQIAPGVTQALHACFKPQA